MLRVGDVRRSGSCGRPSPHSQTATEARRIEAPGRDVYYERGRKPKESIIKYEATRSEGDYPEEGATRAPMRYRRERHGVRGRGRGQTCNRDNMRPGP